MRTDDGPTHSTVTDGCCLPSEISVLALAGAGRSDLISGGRDDDTSNFGTTEIGVDGSTEVVGPVGVEGASFGRVSEDCPGIGGISTLGKVRGSLLRDFGASTEPPGTDGGGSTTT
jgi:hypothetical protein